MTRIKWKEHLNSLPGMPEDTPAHREARKPVIAAHIAAGPCAICDARRAQRKTILEMAMEAAGSDDAIGICVNCGHERSGCEPDARGYKCDNCQMLSVYGAEEIIIMYSR